MKKLSLVVVVLFVLGSFGSAGAMDRTGAFAVGGHFGYSVGSETFSRNTKSPVTNWMWAHGRPAIRTR